MTHYVQTLAHRCGYSLPKSSGTEVGHREILPLDSIGEGAPLRKFSAKGHLSNTDLSQAFTHGVRIVLNQGRQSLNAVAEASSLKYGRKRAAPVCETPISPGSSGFF